MGAQRQYALNTKNDALADSIKDSIHEISQAIAKVPEGKKDLANLNAVFFAIDNMGKENYGYYWTSSNGETETIGSCQWKCNLFVADSYAVGAGVGYDGEDGVPSHSASLAGALVGNNYPPSANMWADQNTNIDNFSVVEGGFLGGGTQLGDIIAYPSSSGSGHSAIYIGGGAVIYASDVDVKTNTVVGTANALTPKVKVPSIVIRRYNQQWKIYFYSLWLFCYYVWEFIFLEWIFGKKIIM